MLKRLSIALLLVSISIGVSAMPKISTKSLMKVAVKNITTKKTSVEKAAKKVAEKKAAAKKAETTTPATKATTAKTETTPSVKTIKILCFGNSFTLDAMSYVPPILKSIDPSIQFEIGLAYIPGCPLVQHVANLSHQPQTLNGATYNEKTYAFYKFTNADSSWQVIGQKDADFMLSNAKWDIVTFQQNGMAAWDSWDTYYAPFINQARDLVKKKYPKVKLGWILTQGAYPTENGNQHEELLEHWKGTARNSKKVVTTCNYNVLFPYGTAVQSMRTTPLDSLGDAKSLTADQKHLNEGIGCLAAAYANVMKIFQLVGSTKTVWGDKTRPTMQWVINLNVQDRQGKGVIGITEDNCKLAQQVAILAIQHPYSTIKLTPKKGKTVTYNISGVINCDH